LWVPPGHYNESAGRCQIVRIEAVAASAAKGESSILQTSIASDGGHGSWQLEKGGTREIMKRYAVVFEKAENNWAAYVPDLPGCVTTGKTLEETSRNVREAIELHLESMHEVGETVPEPTSRVGFVELAPFSFQPFSW
jgi:predicted RNase H-like HicB family nuclease